MTHLRKMMLEEHQRRNFSENTKECYIRAVERFACYFNRSPDQLGPEHIREFQAHLSKEEKREQFQTTVEKLRCEYES